VRTLGSKQIRWWGVGGCSSTRWILPTPMRDSHSNTCGRSHLLWLAGATLFFIRSQGWCRHGNSDVERNIFRCQLAIAVAWPFMLSCCHIRASVYYWTPPVTRHSPSDSFCQVLAGHAQHCRLVLTGTGLQFCMRGLLNLHLMVSCLFSSAASMLAHGKVQYCSLF
jgi:hypothetical protein